MFTSMTGVAYFPMYLKIVPSFVVNYAMSDQRMFSGGGLNVGFICGLFINVASRPSGRCGNHPPNLLYVKVAPSWGHV